MDATIIDKLYADNASVLAHLLEANEISMYSDLDGKLKKVHVMSAASYFEAEIRSTVEAFVSRASNANAAVIGLVKNKAIERQFHTFFSWKERNANLFFSLFGEEFSKHCREQVKSDREVTEAIAAFMELGETRNKLAHLNFGAFPVEKTSAEIYGLYKRAVPFLVFVRKKLVDESGIPPGNSPAPISG
jgi:uncharacterized protein with PIN domain